MDRILNNTTNRVNQQGNDPQRRENTNNSTSSVYETINDYQIQAAATKHTEAQQDYQWKLQNLELDSRRDDLEESTYQVMTSASCGDISGTDAVTFPPQRYPAISPMHSHRGNRRNPLLMPQEYAIDLEQPINTPGPDNSHPHAGYQFRQCPDHSSSAAAALSHLSPMHEPQGYNDQNFQVYTVNPQFGPVSLPNVLDNDDDAPEKAESDAPEEEQEYTFMSQAGTLSGMNSQAASCSYISSDVGGQKVSAYVDKNGQSKVSEC